MVQSGLEPLPLNRSIWCRLRWEPDVVRDLVPCNTRKDKQDQMGARSISLPAAAGATPPTTLDCSSSQQSLALLLFLHHEKKTTYVVVQEPDPVDGAMSISPLRRIPVDGLVDERAPDAAESVRGARQSLERRASSRNFGEEAVVLVDWSDGVSERASRVV